MLQETESADELTISFTATFFRESAELSALLERVRAGDDAAAALSDGIVSRYREQPHLLDAHLAALVDQLLVGRTVASLPASVWRVAYALMRVRGAKVVWKFLPHDVHLLVPLLDFVERCDGRADASWHALYVSLYWLAVLVLVPFRFAVFAEGSAADIDDRIRAVVQARLADAGPTRDAAAFLAAQWLARGDAPEPMSAFLRWCLAGVNDASTTDCLLCGVLRALAHVFRVAPRAILGAVSDDLLRAALAMNDRATDSQRLLLKVIQRATLALMPVLPRAAGDGERVRRMFASAVSDDDNNDDATAGSAPVVVEADLPPQLERVLDVLMRNLAGASVGGRWMAAKGVARICARLPAPLVAEVVESALLSEPTSELSPAALHGACLLLAELLRRGVMPPLLRDRALREVATSGMLCDQRRGQASTGSAARDAAAYAMWAAARAVPQAAMAPLLGGVIAPALAVMAVTDRDVNCRRAAAAAMQENIGRHGSFADGIAIVTLLDFHAVGNVTHCFRSLLPRLAALGDFFAPLLAHLVDRTSRHWHAEQRALASDALMLLALMRTDAVLAKVPLLVARARSTKDAAEKHGALLALAAICEAVVGAASLPLPAGADAAAGAPTEAHVAAMVAACESLPSECAHPAAMRAAGGALVVAAATRLVGALCELNPGQRFDEMRRSEFVALFRLALASDDDACRRAGAAAIAVYASEFAEETKQLVAPFVQQLEAPRTATSAQVGACLALGALRIADDDWARVLPVVAATTCLARVDCAVRAAACAALGQFLVRRFASRADALAADADVAVCLDALNRALGDHTTDAHGDVGASVREAAADALVAFVKRGGGAYGSAATACVQQFAALLPELCFERIDRLRAVMCAHFVAVASVAASPLPVADDAVEAIFAARSDTWSSVAAAVPLLVRLVECAPLRAAALRGIASALDGATRQLAEQVRDSLLALLTSASDERLADVVDGIAAAFATLDARTRPAFWVLARETLDCARIGSAAVPTVDRLCGVLCGDVVAELARARSFANARNAAPALASCALRSTHAATRHAALQQLTILVACSWPVIRRWTGEQLARVVAQHGDALQLVQQTEWDGDDMDTVRRARNAVCGALGIAAPVPAVKK